MRTDIAQPIRLKDYRPPDWLVETVALDVSLHPTQTKVRATLALKPNPQSAAAPLALDGDGLSLVSLKLDGAVLPTDAYVATPDNLTIAQAPNRPFTLEIETLVDPSANTQLSGLYRSSGTYCTLGNASETITLVKPSSSARTAAAPKRIAASRSKDVGDPPRTR